MLDPGPQNILFWCFITNLASFTTAGPADIYLKGLIVFNCRHGQRKMSKLYKKGLYAHSGPWRPAIRPFFAIFDLKIVIYGQKDIEIDVFVSNGGWRLMKKM